MQSARERAERSEGIVTKIVRSPGWLQASRVLVFAPLAVEPDLDLLWRDNALRGKRCAYPRVEGASLQPYYVNGLEELIPTRWGLREPPAQLANEAALDDFNIVLVPGLAFDAAGGRLGRGGGFYDRLLAGRTPARTRLIGVGFACQQVEGALPLGEHDVRMDEIVTS